MVARPRFTRTLYSLRAKKKIIDVLEKRSRRNYKIREGKTKREGICYNKQEVLGSLLHIRESNIVRKITNLVRILTTIPNVLTFT